MSEMLPPYLCPFDFTRTEKCRPWSNGKLRPGKQRKKQNDYAILYKRMKSKAEIF